MQCWLTTRFFPALRLPLNRSPTEHSIAELIATQSHALLASELVRNPFIYNPGSSNGPAATVRPKLVQHDLVEVAVTLQNPYRYDLEIQDIALRYASMRAVLVDHSVTTCAFISTSGVAFNPDHLATVIPAASYHTVRLRGVPLEAGILTVRGCTVKLAGCVAREFVLAMWDGELEVTKQKNASLDTVSGRIKATGLQAREPCNPQSHADLAPELNFIECVVVEEQPMLWLRSTSLTHGALMLYDGERCVRAPRSSS